MGLADSLKETIEKQMNAVSEKLAAAEAQAKAKKARAEADVAGAELEGELLGNLNELKEKLAKGQAYLEELAEAGDEKAEQIKAKISGFFD